LVDHRDDLVDERRRAQQRTKASLPLSLGARQVTDDPLSTAKTFVGARVFV